MTRASSRFAIGAMAAILALGRDDPLVVAMPERHPEPPQEKPPKTIIAVDPTYDASDIRQPGPLPWGSTKYQRARMRQAARLRARETGDQDAG